mgnify:CR=1 FL=1
MKKNILKNNGVQSLLASLVCVILGLLIGYIVLLFINPEIGRASCRERV